ncbi:FAD-dependent monooxygenase [Paenarthrobacter nicotinovorans]|uniref:FAD-dependent monooxygenase n=1 Tax=Paenarthrobacter nicotinovorans TaxID=29320 RepID=UPI003749F845
MKKKALVVGLGIAGMSAAVALRQAGWEPVIVERSMERRTGGYFVGLFAPGKDAAAKLGVLDDIGLEARTLHHSRTWEVDRRGKRHASAGFLDEPSMPAGILRSDVEAALWKAVEGQIDVRFGTTPVSIATTETEATVELYNAFNRQTSTETFDLVVGADGLRSSVRQMVFGPHEQFMKSWDSIICAFQMDEHVPGFDRRDGLVAAEVGRSLWVFPFENHPPTALFTFRTKDIDAQFADGPATALERKYAGLDHDSIRHAMAQLGNSEFSLYDSVHSVEMPEWRKGRVILLGDSAWCLTLYSGMGASSALKGGAHLSEVLSASPDDVTGALNRWEGGMREFIAGLRKPARKKHEIFVPSTWWQKIRRSALLRFAGKFYAPQADAARRAVAEKYALEQASETASKVA